MKTIVKFFKNPHKKRADKHPVITRTLKKIGFVSDSAGPDKIPRDSEFWVVEIERAAKSTFILKPIRKIEDPSSILKLIPGFYTVDVVDNIVIVKPRLSGEWLLPKALKSAFGYVDGVIVVYDEPPKPENDKSKTEPLVTAITDKTTTNPYRYYTEQQNHDHDKSLRERDER